MSSYSLGGGTAAPAPANLPQPIIIEILVRLPVKSLLRFCCTCRFWRDLILHDPYFIQQHRLYHETKQEPTFALFPIRMPPVGEGVKIIMIPAAAEADANEEEDDEEEEEMSPVISLSPLPLGIGDYGRPDRVVVSALCCHGLVLIYNYGICDPKIDVVHVHNIATRKTVKLPAGTPASYQVAGLCYDGLANVYKVVRMFSHYISPFHCEIFTLGVSNSWTPIATIHQLPPAKHKCALFTFSNNALHWMDMEYATTTANTAYESKVILVIRAFDPTTEKTDTIPMPRTLTPELYDATLTQLKGCLGLVDGTLVGDLDIWMMVDYMNRSWVKAFSISLRAFSSFCPRPISINRNGNIILFRCNGYQLLLYNTRTKLAYQLEVPRLACQCSAFTQSLVPVGR